MSGGNTPRDEAELEAFLVRKSSIAADYDSLELVEPPAELDAAILATAKAAAKPVAKPATAAKPAPAPTVTPQPARPVTKPAPPRASIAETQDDDEAPPTRRPRWLVPAALAAAVLLAVGVGVNMLGGESTETEGSPFAGSLFAKRARDRREAEKTPAAAEAAQGEEAAVPNGEPPPPPPVFEGEGPQVQDFDAAISLIRKDLLLANQSSASAEDTKAASLVPSEQAARAAKAPAGAMADTASATADAPVTTLGVVQPRERRLAKILELYDGGQQDLAADSLEIFLRDFEDDPISQRILAIKP